MWEARGKNAVLERSLKCILNVIKLAIWGLAVILLLDNLGFKVSAVIAGLGIGGVAVALAAQAILGDLFSYFAIVGKESAEQVVSTEPATTPTQTTEPTTTTTEPTELEAPEPEAKGMSATVWIVIIVILIALLILYFALKKKE